MKIIIGLEASKKIKNYINLTKGEISGLGKSHLEEGNIIIDDIVLLKQVCSGTTTELEDDAMMLFLTELINKKEDLEKWNVWWHSHANFGVFWSSTDTGTIESHIGKCSHLVSIVGNQKDEYLGRLDIFPKDTSGFNIPVFHTTNLKVEHEIEPDIEIMFSDLTKEKQDSYTSLLPSDVVKNIEPLAFLRPEKSEVDINIFNQCTLEVEDKVKEKVYKPIIRGGTDKLISYQKPLYDKYGRPVSDKRYRKMIDKYGLEIDKELQDELDLIEEEYTLPSHRNTYDVDGLENINKKYNIDTTKK